MADNLAEGRTGFLMVVFALTGVDVSVSSLCAFLHRLNFPHQRMQLAAKQCNKVLHGILFKIDMVSRQSVLDVYKD